MFWKCFNAQLLKNCQPMILCFGINWNVLFNVTQSLVFWESKILSYYSVWNRTCCRANIAIFMVSSHPEHYWISRRHPLLMTCQRFYLHWAHNYFYMNGWIRVLGFWYNYPLIHTIISPLMKPFILCLMWYQFEHFC